MTSVFRWTGMLMPFLAAALLITACAKHPPAAGPASPPQLVAAAPEDKKVIVARVNGAELSQFALIDMMNRMIAINQRMSASEPQDATRKKALDQLVLQELALQEAARQGLHVEDPVLDAAMEKFITNLGHEEGFRDFLEMQHLTAAEFRSQVERSLLIQQILTREVLQKTSVVPVEEVRKEYEQHKDQYRAPEKITLIDVVLFLKQEDSDSQKKAAEVLSRIQAEKEQDPRNLAVDGTFAVRTLDSEKDKEPLLYDAARKLKPGEVSGVISTPDSLHIIKLLEYAPERPLTYEEVSGAIERRLRVAAQQKRRLEWEQELKKDAKIELPDASGRLKPGKP